MFAALHKTLSTLKEATMASFVDEGKFERLEKDATSRIEPFHCIKICWNHKENGMVWELKANLHLRRPLYRR